jgi:transposase
MAYRYGNNRYQRQLMPESIDEYIADDDPVRAYDAFIEALDLGRLGITLDPKKTGNPEYHPKVMLKLLVYGTSYGIHSSRKLERALYHNFSFIWLAQGLKPDHKTIAQFRRRNTKAIARVLKQCATLCIRLNLIEGNTLFLDGSKIRANASVSNTWDKKKIEKVLKRIDKRITKLLTECDRTDVTEEDMASLVTMESKLEDQRLLKDKVEGILKELEEGDEKSINTTDPDCTRINSPHGSHAGYSMQNVVDEKHSLILSTDVASVNNDLTQFALQVDRANGVLGLNCKVACADSGYASTDELEKIDKKGILVVVPSQRQVSEKRPNPFAKECFTYHDEGDYYTCPEGHILTFSRLNKKNRVYAITDKCICFSCPHYGICTISKSGRRVTRLHNEEIREKLEAQYEDNKKIYKKRKAKVEHPFGHIKRNLSFTSFLMRGLDGVRAEASILATCFNLRRMITIFGVPRLVSILRN